MRIANGIMALEFDERNGSLVQITDLKSGQNHLNNPSDGRLFRLFVPDEERWIDRYVDSHESGRPEFVETPGGLEIRFKNLRAGDGLPAAIGATVHVALPAGADEALFTLTIENHESNLICEAIFPWVGGWTGYPGADRGKIRCGSVRPYDPFTMRKPIGWTMIHSHRRHSFPWSCVHAPMCDISNGSVGLSFNLYPTRVERLHDFMVKDLAEGKAGSPRPSWAWVQRPFLKAGGNWTSAPVGLGTHTSDWHATADRLRRWLATWWKAPYAPQRLRHSIGFHNAYFQDWTGREWRPLSALPALAKFGRAHGLDHFCLWDMPFIGLYIKVGKSALLQNPPAREAELRRVLAETRALGVETNALMNLRLIERRNDLWKEWGEDRMVRSRYGYPIPESYPWRANTGTQHSSYLEGAGTHLCQAYPAFQQWAVGQIETALGLGLGTVFFDQPFSEDFCFAEHHGHPVGAPVHAGACEWVARGCDIIRRQSPEAWLMGEVPDIWNTQVCNLWWYWDWNATEPEVFRYLLPQSIQSWVIDVYEHEHDVSRAFALGHLLNVHVRGFELALPDVPEFAARIKQLAALRHKTAAFTMDAQFVDNRGFKLEAPASVHAYRYESPGKSAIILGESGTAAGHVRLTLEDSSRKQATLHRQDGSTEQLALAGPSVEFKLNRAECAVLEC